MILVDNLGDDFPTFPQFQTMLREYEAELVRPKATVSSPTRFDLRVELIPRDITYQLGLGHSAMQGQQQQMQQAAQMQAFAAQYAPPPARVSPYDAPIVAEQMCPECGHAVTLKPGATDTWCETCGPRWRRNAR